MKTLRALFFVSIGIALGTALFRVWPGDANYAVLALALLCLLISAATKGD